MKEQVSALMDGELDEREAERAFQVLKADTEASETWRTYHLISDAMRDRRLLLSAGFTAGMSARLQTEPTILAPAVLGGGPVRRFALAAAASVAAVALVGWLAFAPQPQAPATPPLAQARPAPATTPIVPLPSAANDYLLAHQGFSPRVSLQGMAPYVRTVADHPVESGK
jgi:sigma-E factor negative regulatory protein RseA